MNGSVTAGNSSQMSDGAAFVLIMSEKMVKKELNIEPIARLVNYAVAGVPPKIMGIGPVKAIPKVLKQSNMKINDIDLIELNEAFSSQSLGSNKRIKFEP